MNLDASQIDEATECELECHKDSEVREGKDLNEKFNVTNSVQGSTYLINRMTENHKHIVRFVNERYSHIDLVTCNKIFHEVAKDDVGKFIMVKSIGPSKFLQAAIPFMLRNSTTCTRGAEGGR
jgi:hypothetical protein